MTECADNNPFEVLQRSLMNILRFDQIHGHKKNMMRQNADLQKNSVIFSQRNSVVFFPLLELWNDTKFKFLFNP